MLRRLSAAFYKKRCWSGLGAKPNPVLIPPSSDIMSADDTFQLYDLRVDVICPEGEKPLCGAKPGDYFTLQGEILYLPPGQGISIYSLGKFLEFFGVIFTILTPPPPSKLPSYLYFQQSSA
jgi:hypothetical protein